MFPYSDRYSSFLSLPSPGFTFLTGFVLNDKAFRLGYLRAMELGTLVTWFPRRSRYSKVELFLSFFKMILFSTAFTRVSSLFGVSFGRRVAMERLMFNESSELKFLYVRGSFSGWVPAIRR